MGIHSVYKCIWWQRIKHILILPYKPLVWKFPTLKNSHFFNYLELGLSVISSVPFSWHCQEVNASFRRKKSYLTAKCIALNFWRVDDRRGGTPSRSAAVAINWLSVERTSTAVIYIDGILHIICYVTRVRSRSGLTRYGFLLLLLCATI
jgi:hypothetical protein